MFKLFNRTKRKDLEREILFLSTKISNRDDFIEKLTYQKQQLKAENEEMKEAGLLLQRQILDLGEEIKSLKSKKRTPKKVTTTKKKDK